MSEVSRFINLLIEFGEKLESHVNKKYKPFIRSTLNLQELAKNVNPQKVLLTTEVIAFKLGVQSKSTKCIEMTLGYLLKLFTLGFIDLNAPNFCEDFTILEASIQKRQPPPNGKYAKELREEMVSWLSPLVHFKNQQINNLLLKIYEYLISEPILPSLLELSNQITNEQCHSLICSFFSYRFYIFQEVCEYTHEQLQAFEHLGALEKTRYSVQIKNAMDREEAFENLIQKYLEQIISKVSGEGGKYGCCVICGQGAEYYCKSTKAALCGMDCKNKHLQIAEKQYKMRYQSIVLKQSIEDSLSMLCSWLAEKDSPFLLSVFLSIIEKPYLFMLIRSQFKSILKKHLPKVMDRAYQSKHDQTFETLYFMIPSLAKCWTPESLPEVEYFFRENILRVLGDKKPTFRALMLVFKSLDRIFQNGKTTVELYINLDCERNRTNAIGQTLFQLSKMAQDRFLNAVFYSKQQKISIKNSCMTLFITLCKNLNDFRVGHLGLTLNASRDHYFEEKNRKNSLEKFVAKFNEHWSEGLKSLFNLNLVGLDSDHEIVNIIMSHGALNKNNIDAMLFDKSCERFLQIFMSRLTEQTQSSLIHKLLDLFQFIPLSQNSTIGIKKFIEAFEPHYRKGEQIAPLPDQVHQIVSFLFKCKSYKQFISEVRKYHQDSREYDYLYLKLIKARKPETGGAKNPTFIVCLSHSYLETLSSQLSLLQIPLSYLLETDYDCDRILSLSRELIPISLHSNWVSLLIKYTGMDACGQKQLTSSNIKLIRGILDILTNTADFIHEDWLPILTFFCNLHYLLTQTFASSKKYLIENQTYLASQISMSMVENSLISSSVHCNKNFSKFCSTVLDCALQSLKHSGSQNGQQEQVFMLQKFFHILEVNLSKYLKEFSTIFPQFRQFVNTLSLSPKHASPEIFIYISDNLKQILLKLLKLMVSKKSSSSITEEQQQKITAMHFQVFKTILQPIDGPPASREVGDFVMNCITTIVVHHYHVGPKTWRDVIRMIEEHADDYPYQTSVMMRKILSQKMIGLERSQSSLIQINLKLARSKRNDDKKSCVEAIYNIKTILTVMVENYYLNGSQKQQEEENLRRQIDEEQFVARVKELLSSSIEQLLMLLENAEFSQSVAETIFKLFSFTIKSSERQARPLLSLSQHINPYIKQMFAILEDCSLRGGSQQDTAERIMNETLYWSVKNNDKGIIQNLESAVIGKFSKLSITALKCIKTYIQMANPKDEADWGHIEVALMNIIRSTLLQGIVNQTLGLSEENLAEALNPEKILSNGYHIELTKNLSGQPELINNFAHHSRLQTMAVELLPNDGRCLPLLVEAYKQKIEFNDNIMKRVYLWKMGLCRGKGSPPDLLSLEEIVSNRIMAIFIRLNDATSIIQFCVQIFHRYIQASDKLDSFNQWEAKISAESDNSHYQLFNIVTNYYTKRKQPLLKLIGYILPKLPKYCADNATRKHLLLELSKILPSIQKRDPFLKTIRELSLKQF